MNEIQRRVFQLLVQALNENSIEFQITGGLAVLAYGGNRSLYDIDIEIYKKDKEKVRELFKEYIVEDWIKELEDEEDIFDGWVLKLEIQGVPIDISQIEDVLIRSKDGRWIRQPETMNSQIMEIEGMSVPVQDKEGLIEYKKIMRRDIDLVDIEQIS
jgi:hypothetical protein